MILAKLRSIDVFPAEIPPGLPPIRGIEHQIDLIPGASLPNRAAYRTNPEETKEIQRQVQDLLDHGYVHESLSPCAVLVILVPKKDGSWRMCVDCRAINNITIRYRHPIPRLDDMLDELSGSILFSKVDLRSGYHQIRMKLGDEWKTAFKTKFGLYEWLVMPFGLTNAPSTFMRLMNESLHEHMEIQRQVQDLLDRGYVRKSLSPCAVPVILVPKKDGSWRMCVDCRAIDCRAINNITIRYRHPIPRLDDMLDELSGSIIFSKVNLRSGYHQIRMKLGDEWKTSFKTKFGLYEWLVMHFGLTNAPSTFVRLMNEVLRAFIGKFVVVNFDDILIYSMSLHEHMDHLRAVFDALRAARLFGNIKKCTFCTNRVSFLGYVVTPQGIEVDKPRFKLFVVGLRLRRSHKCGASMDLLDFTIAFTITAPLNELTKKGVAFHWGKPQEDAFNLLKDKLTHAPLLQLLDFGKTFELECDASGVGIGGVLMQENKPVAYFSKKIEWSCFELFNKGKDNVIADALSRRYTMLFQLDHRIFGLESIKEQYAYDEDFKDIMLHCKEGRTWDKYVINDGFVFRANSLCIPVGSVRLLLLQEAHGGRLMGHFGAKKTEAVLSTHFIWPKMR
ncbi:hypothetical protein U9M48_028146 [Paspalum notatum var. saurae]|uniref:Reverse transcriptase domain-containing protein n=1 Tax=Paspalum notatum var. saurae TaxID=547442 RepID=A0AAQ3TWK3_PASNO